MRSMSDEEFRIMQEAFKDYGDKAQEQDQFDEKQKLEQKKLELQKQELDIKQQQQNTQQMLVYGGLGLGAVLVTVVSIAIVIRLLRRGVRKK